MKTAKLATLNLKIKVFSSTNFFIKLILHGGGKSSQ